MNYRGVANSTFLYALNNKKILKNESLIFYNKVNRANKMEVLKKFKEKFKIIGVNKFGEIDHYKEKLNIDYLYVQKGGEKDSFNSKNIETMIHCMYPQKISEVHGYSYAYISEWLSYRFSNYKIPYVPLIVEIHKTKQNLKKKLKIKKEMTVIGCHGGESSFDLDFVRDVIKKILKKRKDIFFLFLNINKFYKHPRVKFFKGTTNEPFKKKFLNSCDVMLYGRSLGESFGLACGEFGIINKKIISYRFNRHKSHKFNLNKKQFLEYGSYDELLNLLFKISKSKQGKFYDNKYKSYNTRFAMKKFNEIFIKRKVKINTSFIDNLINLLSRLSINYLYLRHKVYSHYYKYFRSKFI